MSDFAVAVLRDFIIKALGIVFAWVGVHFVAIPEHDKAAITNWAVLTATAGLMLVWSIVVHFLESRTGNNPFAVLCRALGRLLMFGIKLKPSYARPVPPAPEPVPAPIRQVGPNGQAL